MERILLAGKICSRNHSSDKDQKLVNVYSSNRQKDTLVISRPGIVLEDNVGSTLQGLFGFNDNLYEVVSGILKKNGSILSLAFDSWVISGWETFPNLPVRAMASQGGKLHVAVSNSETRYTTIDGTIFIAETPNFPVANLTRGISFGSNAFFFQNFNRSVYKWDGTSFTTTTTVAPWSVDDELFSVTVHNSKIYISAGVVSSSRPISIYSTEDGISFTTHTSNALSSDSKPIRIGIVLTSFGNSLYIASGRSVGPSESHNDVYSSTDNGVNWSEIQPNSAWGVCTEGSMWASSGKLFFLRGSLPAPILKDLWSSTDGVTWVQVISDIFGADFTGDLSFKTFNAAHNDTMFVGASTLNSQNRIVYANN